MYTRSTSLHKASRYGSRSISLLVILRPVAQMKKIDAKLLAQSRLHVRVPTVDGKAQRRGHRFVAGTHDIQRDTAIPLTDFEVRLAIRVVLFGHAMYETARHRTRNAGIGP